MALVLAVGAGALRAETRSTAAEPAYAVGPSSSPASAQRVPTGPTAPFGYPSPWIFGFAPSASQSGTPTVEGQISYDGVWANGFTSFGSITFTIRQSPGGTVLATGSKTADSGGNAQFNRWQDHYVDLTVGMQVTATDGSTTKTLTLVPLSVTIVNATTNVVSGTAPASSPVHVDAGEGMSWTGKDTTADGTGHWSIDFSPFDITANMQAIAKVSDADGDVTSYGKQPPRIDGSLTQDAISANEFTPNASIAFTIRQSPGGTVLAQGTKQADGGGNAQFNRNQDHDVDLKTGMQITASDGTLTKDLTLAALAITAVDPATDDVTGTAPAGSQIQVNVNSPGSWANGQATADGSGHWAVDFSGVYDITYRSNASANVADADGDQTQAARGVAQINVGLTGDGVQAWSFAAGGSVMFTIRQSPGGTVLASGTRPADDQGNAQFLRPQDHNVDLAPGMQVTVSDGAITKGVTLAAVAVTSVEPATDVVTGTAPADAPVEVSISNVWGVNPLQVTADVNGHWSADFTGTFDVTFLTQVNASVRDADGDATSAWHGAAWIEAFLAAGVNANGFAANVGATLTIRQAPGGAVLASVAKSTDAQGNAQFWRGPDYGVVLAPGMQVTVSDGSVTKGLTLVGVTIDSIDVATDVVAGTAPADAQVQVDVNDHMTGGQSKQVTADANGNWSADFGGLWDVTYSTFTNARVHDGDGDATAASKQPAVINASLTGDAISADNFAANAPVTFTIRQSPGGTVLASGTTQTDAGGHAAIMRYQEHEVDLVPGMQVTVTDGTITKDLTLAPIAITSINPATEVVAGTAPADAQVQVNVNDESGGTGMQVAADGGGHWSASFVGTFDITYGTNAGASVTDSDGDQTSVWRPPTQIQVDPGSDDIWGNGFAENASVDFTIRQSPGGAVLASGSTTTGDKGNFGLNRWQDYDVDLVPGMQVEVSDGTTTKQLTLVALSIDFVDPATDIVVGTAPAGADVQADVGDDQGNGTGQATTADGSGHWSVDFSPFDITYSMGANAQVRDADGDATNSSKGPARIHVALSWDGINAEGFAGDAGVTFTIRQSPGGAVLATGSRTSDPQGNVEFDRGDAFDVDLVPGMQVTVTDGTLTKQLTLAALAITSVDPPTDVVGGTAPPGAQVDVNVGDDQDNGTQQTTTADGSGHWSIDFSPFDITYAMWANAQVSDQDGDNTGVDSGPTTIDVSLTWDVISGNNFAADTSVTFTIRQSPGGTVLASDSRTSDSQGYVEFDRWDVFDVDLVPGMQVTVGDGTTTKQLTLVLVGITRVDPPTDTVAGTAAPGAEVRVDVGDDQNGTNRTVTADGTGHWSIDFSDTFDITYWANASARVGDNDGDTTGADKNAPQIWSNLTYDDIAVQGFASNASISFTIRQTPGGTVLATGNRTSDEAGGVDFSRGDAFDVDLLPGMQITVTDGTATKQLTLAALGIARVDPSTDTVSGTAIAGAEIQVDVGDDQNGTSQSTTADGSGHWSVHFSQFDITYTMNASAHTADADGDQTAFDKSAPRMDVEVTSDSVWVQGFASNASVGFTIRQTPGGAVLASGNRTSDAGGSVDFNRPADFNVDLLPGMQITITDGTVTKYLTLAAVAVLSVDPATDVVAGVAPPNALVHVGVGDMVNGAGQDVTADGDGNWSVDFSPFDVTPTMTANAGVEDSDNDVTWTHLAPDTAPPVASIDSGPSGLTSDSTPTFTFSANEPSTFECKVDSGSWTACTSPRTTVTLADGAHTFQVRATDTAGNVGTAVSRSFTVDTVAPQTTIDSGPSGPTNDSTPTFGFSTEAGATFECKVDSGSWAACTSPYTTAVLTDGAHTLQVRATDAAGNVDATPASRSFTVDTVAPQTTIDSGPSGPTNDSTPTFGFSSEAAATFECKLDSGNWTACTSPFTTAVLADGAHTLQVRATDAAGNVDATPASRSFTVDTVAPQTTINSGPAGPTNDSTPAFGFSANESSAFECRVDSGSWTVCTSPFTTATLADGAHTFQVRATDAAGNLGTAASRSFTVDTVAPQTTIDSGPSGVTSDATPTFTFSSEAGATFECRVDSAAFAVCASPFTTVMLADGSHTFYVRAVDAAGNADASPASRSFTVDTGPPETTIDSGPTGLTNDPTPTFTFSSSDNNSTFQCRLDSGAFTSCTSPYTAASLADGQHTFEVKATDSVGNTDATPASRQFTVDTVAPETTIDSGPSGLINDSTPTFGFSSEAAASFECKLDSGNWTACTSPLTTAVLADGTHTFQVRAVDAAGNVDATPASRSFTVDTVAPQTTIDSGPSGLTSDSTPTFGFSSEAGASFECKVDAGGWTACTSPVTTATLTDGVHTFQVRATDAVGNVDATPAGRSFTVDTAAPATQIDSASGALAHGSLTNDRTPTFTFSSEAGASFQCKVDAGSWTACTSPYTTAVLADGAHTFQVRATDAAGNVDTTPASRSFTVDSTAPETTILTGPQGTITATAATFTFSASETATFECRLDGAAFAQCSSPYTTPTLAAGGHTFEVRATDAAENVDSTPASRTFAVAVAHTTVGVVSRTVTVTKQHVAAIKLRCGPADCRGTLSLTVTVRSHGRSRQLQIGSKSFSLAAGRTAKVNVKLTAKGYKLLVQKRKLATKAKITYKQPTGGTTTTTSTVTLQAPARH